MHHEATVIVNKLVMVLCRITRANKESDLLVATLNVDNGCSSLATKLQDKLPGYVTASCFPADDCISSPA